MKLALTLVHNKTPKENEAQINALLSLVTEQIELLPGTDDEGNIIPNVFERRYYTFNDLNIPHEVEFYHIIPFQPENTSNPYNAVLPTNLGTLRGKRVEYGWNDEDKIGDHPRFFNWALKRSTDYGNELNIYIDDHTKLDVDNLPFYINSLVDPDDKHEYIEDKSVKIATLKLLKEVGQLDEEKAWHQAVSDLKDRVEERGLSVN